MINFILVLRFDSPEPVFLTPLRLWLACSAVKYDRVRSSFSYGGGRSSEVGYLSRVLSPLVVHSD